MTQSMGTIDFFLLEGNEYLERLDALAQAPAGAFTAGEELTRVARALRGSAIMASQHGLARAAQGVESCARALRENRLSWTEASRAELIRALDDMKVLMKRLRTPEQGDTEKAEQLGVQLDRLSGRASAAMRAQVGPGLDAGGRAFVAREAASIASVLHQAARSLRSDPSNRDSLAAIAPAMSALRGVAVLSDLPPLGDILSAIEHASKDVLAAQGSMGPEAAEIFEAGAKALARSAREVVDAGRPDAESDEAGAFAARLFASVGGRGTVVPVETLFYDDAGPHVVKEGSAPGSGAGLARVEMVSHGEYLTAANAEISRAATPVQRDLRLFGIAASVRPMMAAAGSALASALGKLALAAREAIGSGAASLATDTFTRSIQDAAAALSAAQDGDEQQLASRLERAAAALSSMTVSADAMRRTPAPTPAPKLPEPVVTAAPAPAPEPAAPRPAGATGPALQEADLATSYLTLEQLIADRGLDLGSLDELLEGGTPMPGRPTMPRTQARTVAPAPAAPAAPAALPPIVPVESLAPDDAGVVPIESLLYRGDAALRRALELKNELATAATVAGGSRLNDLLREVFDLVELGLGSGR